MLIYNKTTQQVLGKFNELQSIEITFQHYTQEFRDNLGILELEDVPINYHDYKVINGELVESPIDVEIVVSPLENRIKELEDIIDTMLGVDNNGV